MKSLFKRCLKSIYLKLRIDVVIENSFKKYFKKNRTLISINKRLNSIENELKVINDQIRSIYENTYDFDNWLIENKNRYQGQRCFLVGGGPSLNKINLSLLDNEFVMAVNGSGLIANLKVDFFCSVSYHWYETFIDEIQSLQCQRIFLPHYLSDLQPESSPVSRINCLENKYLQKYGLEVPLFFSKDSSRVVTLGGSVIIVSLQILYYLGFSEIILLGIDHNFNLPEKSNKYEVMVEAKDIPHFSEDYFRKNSSIPFDVSAMERGYQLADDAFKEDNRKILNATEGTKLDIFEKVKFEELFNINK